MEVFAVPIEGKYLLYRPLRHLAFIGNRAMADLTLDMVRDGDGPGAAEGRHRSSAKSREAVRFLQTIGFLEPDPPPPPLPGCEYRPTTAVLLLTSRCNLRCTYCYASGGERPVQDLSPALARAAIDEAHRNAVEQGQARFELIFHGGGEPVQAWDVVQEAVAYARHKDLPCRTSIVTNGVWTARQREWLIQNMDGMGISFDGAAGTQNHQRPLAGGQGSFKAVMHSIKALDEAEFRYGIRMTAIAPWRGSLPQDVAFICEETGCQSIQVEPAFNTDRGEYREPTQAEAEAFVEAFLEAFEIAGRARRQLIFSGARPWLVTHSFCRAPYTVLIVNPAGALVGCFEVTDEAHPLAAMARIGSIDGDGVVLDKGSRAAFHETLAQRRSACRDCFCYWHCAGDCFSRALAPQDISPPGASPRCFMNREITAHILLWYIVNSGGVWRGQGAHPQGTELMRAF
jgi:uncharacterized protein